MESFLLFLSLCTVALVAIWKVAALNAAEVWNSAAEQLGLTLKRTRGWPELTGTLAGTEVEVSATAVGHTSGCCARGADESLTIHPVLKMGSLRMGSRFETRGRPVGDPAFDAAVNVSGPRILMFALLNEETRAKVRRLCGLGGNVSGGNVTLQILGGTEKLSEYIRLTAEVADRLRTPDEALSVTANCVMGGDLRSVQWYAMVALTREAPTAPETLNLCHKLVYDIRQHSAFRVLALEHLLKHADPARWPDLDYLARQASASLREAAVRSVVRLGRTVDEEVVTILLSDTSNQPAFEAGLAACVAHGSRFQETLLQYIIENDDDVLGHPYPRQDWHRPGSRGASSPDKRSLEQCCERSGTRGHPADPGQAARRRDRNFEFVGSTGGTGPIGPC